MSEFPTITTDKEDVTIGTPEAAPEEAAVNDPGEAESKGREGAFAELSPADQATYNTLFSREIAPAFSDIEGQLVALKMDAGQYGSDELKQWIFAIDQKLESGKFDLKDMMVSGGDIQGKIDSLKQELAESIAAARGKTDQAIEAGVEQQRVDDLNKEAQVLSAEAAAKHLAASTVEASIQGAPQVSVYDRPVTTAVAGGSVHTDAPSAIESTDTQVKLGFFEKRRRAKAQAILASTFREANSVNNVLLNDKEKAQLANFTDRFDTFSNNPLDAPSKAEIKKLKKYGDSLHVTRLRQEAESRLLTPAEKKVIAKAEKGK